MKSKDQIALERVYSLINSRHEIKEISVLEEGVWKKIAPYAAAMALGTSAFAGNNTERVPFDVTKNDSVFVKSFNDYKNHEMSIDNIKRNVKKTLQTNLNNKISELIVEVTERKDDKDGYRDVVVSIFGNVIAGSQEEANEIASKLVTDALLDGGINVEDLKIVVENKKKKYNIVVRVILKA